jgi:hypothetical protein
VAGRVVVAVVSSGLAWGLAALLTGLRSLAVMTTAWLLVSVIAGTGAAELVEVLVPLVVLGWLATVRRLGRAWPVLLVATSSTAALSALFWHLLRTAANQLG